MGITTASGAQTHQRTAVGSDPLLIGTGPLHRTEILPTCFPKCEAPFPGQGTNKESGCLKTHTPDRWVFPRIVE